MPCCCVALLPQLCAGVCVINLLVIVMLGCLMIVLYLINSDSADKAT